MSTNKTNQSSSMADNSAHRPKRALQSSTPMNGKRNMSDMSADEADEPQAAKSQRVSAVHEHAEKISVFEYRCRLCTKVRRARYGFLFISHSNVIEAYQMWCRIELQYQTTSCQRSRPCPVESQKSSVTICCYI